MASLDLLTYTWLWLVFVPVVARQRAGFLVNITAGNRMLSVRLQSDKHTTCQANLLDDDIDVYKTCDTQICVQTKSRFTRNESPVQAML